MFDIETKQPEPATIDVADYIEFGRIVADWARSPETRPDSAEELRRQLRDIATLPERIKTVAFVQNDEDTLYVRLPDAKQLAASLRTLRDDCSGRLCDMPYFYRDYFNPGFGPVMSELETFLARLGDGVASEG